LLQTLSRHKKKISLHFSKLISEFIQNGGFLPQQREPYQGFFLLKQEYNTSKKINHSKQMNLNYKYAIKVTILE
jgi:hypothetical protein